MKKHIRITPVNTIVFEIENQNNQVLKIIEFTFNDFATAILEDEFGDIDVLFDDMKTSPYELVSVLLYCGVKQGDASFTLDEARAVVVGGGSQVFTEVCGEVTQVLLRQRRSNSQEKFEKQIKEKFTVIRGKK